MASPNTTLLPPATVAKMSPADQQSYYSSLSPQQADQERRAVMAFKNSINQSNTNYLKKSREFRAVCPVNGGGNSATYPTAGGTLQFQLPRAGGAFLKAIEIQIDIKFTPATGSSATYAWTPAGAFAWLSDVYVLFGGTTQHHVRPYAMKVYDQLRKRMWLYGNQVLSGLNADSTVTSNIAQLQPSLTGGSAAISKGRIRIPFQQHRLSPIGLLPIQGQGTAGQINIVCPTTLGAANPDPLACPINYTGGSGNGITLDGTEKTITVFAIYSSGQNLEQKQPFTLNMDGVPTMQWIVGPQLNNLVTSSVMRQHLGELMQHYLVASVVVDGVQSTSFATAGNITTLELDQDNAGHNHHWLYGTAESTTYYDYAEDFRYEYGQDLDTGVIIWNDALHKNVPDVDLGNGTQVLDMRSGHWPDTHYGIQLGSVSNTNFPARVETYLFSQNDAGLKVASS